MKGKIRICDVKTEFPAIMLLFGKGKKYRQVPLSARTVSHYKKYLKKFHPGEDAYSQEYIFYTIHDAVYSGNCLREIFPNLEWISGCGISTCSD